MSDNTILIDRGFLDIDWINATSKEEWPIIACYIFGCELEELEEHKLGFTIDGITFFHQEEAWSDPSYSVRGEGLISLHAYVNTINYEHAAIDIAQHLTKNCIITDRIPF